MTAGLFLALETSTVACSVAAGGHGRVALRERHEPGAHAGSILPMIDAVLDEAGVTFDALTGIVYGRGPGSFTGVRIAVALAQGLAHGAGVPLLGVSSLALLAQRGLDRHPGRDVLVVQDARMNEVYAGWYRRDAAGVAEPLRDEALLAPAKLEPHGCEVAIGGALDSVDGLRARFAADGLAFDDALTVPGAAEALRFAVRARDSDWTGAADASAVYLRQRVASPGRR